mmetsp:Transcript_19612/g.45649  ORF Transcript_19612/g.45649 Transcript_19612/m.45649 type:complete len:205 (-) Transcript_19612:1680-2294(-)
MCTALPSISTMFSSIFKYFKTRLSAINSFSSACLVTPGSLFKVFFEPLENSSSVSMSTSPVSAFTSCMRTTSQTRSSLPSLDIKLDSPCESSRAKSAMLLVCTWPNCEVSTPTACSFCSSKSSSTFTRAWAPTSHDIFAPSVLKLSLAPLEAHCFVVIHLNTWSVLCTSSFHFQPLTALDPWMPNLLSTLGSFVSSLPATTSFL